MESDDGTVTPTSALGRLQSLWKEASDVAGRPAYLAPRYKSYLQEAGFEDVVERRLKWPLNEWPRDPHHKELGAWSRTNMDNGMDGLLVGLFTRFLGWTQEEVTVFAAQARAELRDRRIHGYIPV